MAGRKVNRGLEYAPLKRDFFTDMKVRKLKRMDKCYPYLYITLVFDFIYTEGYYINWDDDLPIMLSEQTGYDEEDCRMSIDAMFKVGLLSRSMFCDHGILTSRGIQTQWQESKNKSKSNAKIEEFSLLDEPISSEEIAINSEEIPISSEEIAINSEEIPISSEEMQQRKEKKSKEKYSSSFSSSLAEAEKAEVSEEEEEQEIFSIFFFRNWANPEYEVSRLKNWNNLAGGHSWKTMTHEQRISAAELWREEKPTKPRGDPDFLASWQVLYKALVKLKAPINMLKSALNASIRGSTDALDSTTYLLQCPNELKVYLEDNLATLRPILKKEFLKKNNATRLCYVPLQ